MSSLVCCDELIHMRNDMSCSGVDCKGNGKGNGNCADNQCYPHEHFTHLLFPVVVYTYDNYRCNANLPLPCFCNLLISHRKITSSSKGGS